MKDLRKNIIISLCILLFQSTAWGNNILVVGDSISAAFGLEVQTGWVALLQERITQRDKETLVINASISGDTSSGGVARLPALLSEHTPSLLVIELGGNDGLRGTPLSAVQKNLQAMIDMALANDCKVLLLGMQLPPNYGPVYTGEFERVYQRLSKQENVVLVPAWLQGIGDGPDMMQSDGIHPTQAAQGLLLDKVWELMLANHLLE